VSEQPPQGQAPQYPPLAERLERLALETTALSAHIRLRAARRSLEHRKLSRATIEQLRDLSGRMVGLCMALDGLIGDNTDATPLAGWHLPE
jgi:hypothetical protein